MSCFNLGSSRLLRQSLTDWCSGKVVIVARRMIPLLREQRQAHSPTAGTAESQMPSPLSWGIGRAATLLKTLLQYYGKSSEALPGVAYPGFRDNRSTLKIQSTWQAKVYLCTLYILAKCIFAGITVFIYQHVKLQPHVEGVQIFNMYSKTDR